MTNGQHPSSTKRTQRGRTPDEDELVDLHECILSTDVRGRRCEKRGCGNDALVMASVPRHPTCTPVCSDCLPEHVHWYEIQPEEYRAHTVEKDIAASLNPEVDYVR
jgi:hypothetical protein